MSDLSRKHDIVILEGIVGSMLVLPSELTQIGERYDASRLIDRGYSKVGELTDVGLEHFNGGGKKRTLLTPVGRLKWSSILPNLLNTPINQLKNIPHPALTRMNNHTKASFEGEIYFVSAHFENEWAQRLWGSDTSMKTWAFVLDPKDGPLKIVDNNLRMNDGNGRKISLTNRILGPNPWTEDLSNDGELLNSELNRKISIHYGGQINAPYSVLQSLSQPDNILLSLNSRTKILLPTLEYAGRYKNL